MRTGNARLDSDFALPEAYMSSKLAELNVKKVPDEDLSDAGAVRKLMNDVQLTLGQVDAIPSSPGQNKILFTDSAGNAGDRRLENLRNALFEAMKKEDKSVNADLMRDSDALAESIRSGGVQITRVATNEPLKTAKVLIGFAGNDGIKLLERTITLDAQGNGTAAAEAWRSENNGDGNEYKIDLVCAHKVTCDSAEITLTKMNGEAVVAIAKMIRRALDYNVEFTAVRAEHARSKELMERLNKWKQNVTQKATSRYALNAIRLESFSVAKGISTLALTIVDDVKLVKAAENAPGVDRRTTYIAPLGRKIETTNNDLKIKFDAFVESAGADDQEKARGQIESYIDHENVYLIKNEGTGEFTIQLATEGTGNEEDKINLIFKMPTAGTSGQTGSQLQRQDGARTAEVAPAPTGRPSGRGAGRQQQRRQ